MNFDALGARTFVQFVGTDDTLEDMRRNLKIFRPTNQDLPIMRKAVLLQHIDFYKACDIRAAPYWKACACGVPCKDAQSSDALCKLCEDVRTSTQIPEYDIPAWVQIVKEDRNVQGVHRADDGEGARVTETNHLGQASLRHVFGSSSSNGFDLRLHETIFLRVSDACDRWVRAMVVARLSESPTPIILVQLATFEGTRVINVHDAPPLTLVAHREGGTYLGSQLEFFQVLSDERGNERRRAIHGKLHIGEVVRVSEYEYDTNDEVQGGEYTIVDLHKPDEMYHTSSCLGDGTSLCRLIVVLESTKANCSCVALVHAVDGHCQTCWMLHIGGFGSTPSCKTVIVRRMSHYIIDQDASVEVNPHMLGFHKSLATGLQRLHVKGNLATSDDMEVLLHSFDRDRTPVNEYVDGDSYVATHLRLHPCFRGKFGPRHPATWDLVHHALDELCNLVGTRTWDIALGTLDVDSVKTMATQLDIVHEDELIGLAPTIVVDTIIGRLQIYTKQLLVDFGYDVVDAALLDDILKVPCDAIDCKKRAMGCWRRRNPKAKSNAFVDDTCTRMKCVQDCLSGYLDTAGRDGAFIGGEFNVYQRKQLERKRNLCGPIDAKSSYVTTMATTLNAERASGVEPGLVWSRTHPPTHNTHPHTPRISLAYMASCMSALFTMSSRILVSLVKSRVKCIYIHCVPLL